METAYQQIWISLFEELTKTLPSTMLFSVKCTRSFDSFALAFERLTSHLARWQYCTFRSLSILSLF
jgi:hypothetical protein